MSAEFTSFPSCTRQCSGSVVLARRDEVSESCVIPAAELATDLGEMGGRTGAAAKLGDPPARSPVNASAAGAEPVATDFTALMAVTARGPNLAGLSVGIAFLKKLLRAFASVSGFTANANADSFLARSASALTFSWI